MSPAPVDPTGPDPLLDAPSWAPRWLPTVDDAARVRMFSWVVMAVFVAGLGACVLRGADEPADPGFDDPGIQTIPTSDGDGGLGAPTSSTFELPVVEDADARGEELAGIFGTIVVQLEAASGEVWDLCMLYAEQAAERSRGLMQVETLGSYDGMLFEQEPPASGNFYMFRTLLPLSIAWWDQRGGLLNRAEMLPCTSDDPDACERYPSGGDWRHAIEVPLGSEVADAFAPGTVLTVTGESCTASA